jgi:hypothetical protein
MEEAQAVLNNHQRVWAEVVASSEKNCGDCRKANKNYMSLPFSHFAVCIKDQKIKTDEFYVVSSKDLYEGHRAIEGSSTAHLNTVITSCIHQTFKCLTITS